MSEDRSLRKFLADFGEPSGREVIRIDVTGTKIGDPPLIMITRGDTVAVIDPMAMAGYLGLDVHAFHAGQPGAAGGMGMTLGRAFSMFDDSTGLRIDATGHPHAVNLACLFIAKPKED